MTGLPGILRGRAVDRRFGSGAEPQLGAGAAAKGNQAGAAVADDDFSVHVPLYLAVQHRAHGAGQAQRGRAQVLSKVGTPRNGRSASRARRPSRVRPPVPRPSWRPGSGQVFPQSADRVDVGITRGDPLQGLAHGLAGRDLAIGDGRGQPGRVEEEGSWRSAVPMLAMLQISTADCRKHEDIHCMAGQQAAPAGRLGITPGGVAPPPQRNRRRPPPRRRPGRPHPDRTARPAPDARRPRARLRRSSGCAAWRACAPRSGRSCCWRCPASS